MVVAAALLDLFIPAVSDLIQSFMATLLLLLLFLLLLSIKKLQGDIFMIVHNKGQGKLNNYFNKPFGNALATIS